MSVINGVNENSEFASIPNPSKVHGSGFINTYRNTVLPSLESMNMCRKKGKYIDLIIHVSDVSIPVHKIVLESSGSEFFKALLDGKYGEPDQQSVNVKGFTPKFLSMAIDLIYGESVFDRVTSSMDMVNLLLTLKALGFAMDDYGLEYAMIATVKKLGVPNNIIATFILACNDLMNYEDGLLDIIIRQITGFVDFTPIKDDDWLHLIFSSSLYQDLHGLQYYTYKTMKNLVDSGRDPNFYSWVNYSEMDQKDRNKIPKDIQVKYQRIPDYTRDMRNNNNDFHSWLVDAVIDQGEKPKFIISIAILPSSRHPLVKRYLNTPISKNVTYGLILHNLSPMGKYMLVAFTSDMSQYRPGFIYCISVSDYMVTTIDGTNTGNENNIIQIPSPMGMGESLIIDVYEFELMKDRVNNMEPMKNFLVDGSENFNGIQVEGMGFLITQYRKTKKAAFNVAAIRHGTDGYAVQVGGLNTFVPIVAHFTGSLPEYNTIIRVVEYTFNRDPQEEPEDIQLTISRWNYI